MAESAVAFERGVRAGVDVLEARVRAVIDSLEVPGFKADQSADRDLYDAGMTSHTSVRLMLALEDEFDVEYPGVAGNGQSVLAELLSGAYG